MRISSNTITITITMRLYSIELISSTKENPCHQIWSRTQNVFTQPGREEDADWGTIILEQSRVN